MPDAAQQWITKLQDKLKSCASDHQKWDRYYEGEQPLSFISPELLKELDGRIRAVVLNWPELVVDSLDERLDVEGFRYGNDADADQGLWDIWQANGLDEGSQQAHLEALINRRSFVILGTQEDSETPRITVESPLQVTADWDPQTRKVRAAIKAWTDGDEEFVTLYTPNSTARYAKAADSRTNEWKLVADADEHNLGTVPVVPIVNRGRLLKPDGKSEIASIAPLSDAACKIATDMMVGAEYHALPRRWVFGMKPEDFVDKDGKKQNMWQQLTGRVWANPNEKINAGQFPEADLKNFHETINILAAQVAALTGLPPSALGLTTQNPASADAIRSAEARLVKRAERRQRSFGGSWEDVMRLAVQLSTGELPEKAHSLETLWADASTPTVAQKADAAVKLVQAGIIPATQAQEDLGYTTTQRARMKQQREEAALTALDGDIAALVGAKPAPVPAPAVQ